MSKNTSRVRNYELITYHTEEVIKAVLSVNSSRVRHYAYILHDKDVKDDGSSAEVHFHVLLCFNNAITASAVTKLFPEGQNTFPAPMRDKADCFNYLDHADCPDKYQYPHESIVCDDLGYWQDLQRGEDDIQYRVLNIIDDILSGIGLYELAKRYGRDIVINYDRYKDFAFACYSDGSVRRKSSKEVKVVEQAGSTPFDVQGEIDPETGEVQ